MAATTDFDQYVLDAIATLLGTSSAWSGSGAYLDIIAGLVSIARPDVDGLSTEYADRFRELTGRDVVDCYDQTSANVGRRLG